MKSKMFFAGALILLAAVVTAGDDPKTVAECRVRKGLPNVLTKMAAASGPVTVCYLGGSITSAHKGWRSKTMEWFKKEYPRADVRELHAAIPGTGADYGATRFSVDVLAKGVPDLLFIEFRVNGGSKPAVEGIIRQMWKANPRADICFVYTIGEWMVNEIRAGRHSPFCTEMEELADYYGIPSVDLGVEIVRRLDAGTLVFRGTDPVPGKLVFTRDGCHPVPAGHAVYCEVLARSIRKMSGQPFVHELGVPATPNPWEKAELIPASVFLKGNSGWRPVDTAADPVYRNDYGRTENMLRGARCAEKEGASFTVKWEGTALLFSDIPQDLEMIAEVSVDGGKAFQIKRNRTKEVLLHARFWSVWQPRGTHTAVITVKKLPAGQRFFCGQMQVVGKYLAE